ncbi:DEAD/DEAH box helicase family protein [Gabonibacter chumensis]|uniref:DEAD/DEAH box helicase family protein n=1 Tax=Gabonibacter chumensis TaxID=2972474 RepID=UPI0025740361|nr:DEAD/DEAH box helicase family protein [Gabonibacter chumensis]MCR9012137.1 DEAD/DEAH box helicase family protein [Gabonibacter chumensis]
MLKTDIIWPNHRRYKSRTEWEPIGFFLDCLCNSTQFDLMLGFFSSSAISILANGFATFLYNGGKMRLVINDILTENDKDAIAKGVNTKDDIPYFDVTDIECIYETLSERDKHFFDCISWLIRNNRIDIKIISPKNGIGISHTKSGIFYDGLNTVGFDGSCNFSRTALVDNIESLTVSCDWDGNIETAKINAIQNEFEGIITEQDNTVSYISVEDIKTQITNVAGDKTLTELLETEYEILNQYSNGEISNSIRQALDKAKDRVEAIIEKINSKKERNNSHVSSLAPSFPYPSGPRDYQMEAFEKWKNNKQKGLFTMATGTGKTITSLNCLLEIYKKFRYYKALILVPTITLVEQWEKECAKFQFDNVVKVCSKYHGWQTSLANIRMLELSYPDNKQSYVIISTYTSFIRPDNFIVLNQFPKNKLLLIADEAHNMGSGRIARRLQDVKYLRRIGLSATPERQFDEEGNARLMDFFGCNGSYTFEYSMEEAIQKGALCKYYYYPHLVKLTDDEMAEYVELSHKIAKIINREDEDSKEILKRLLLKRKQIIHKARNKKDVFRDILQERIKAKGTLKYTLVYVPEGNKPDDFTADVFDNSDTIKDDEDTVHLIKEYTSIVRDIDSHIVVRQFTSESTDRDIMLKDFASGSIDVLTSMKCLDEGVDVPRSELAIFCASTGNPRQFIQRRGRVLRTHKDKRFAIIHDLVVIPENNSDESCRDIEKSLVAAEIRRVRDFAVLSENCNDTLNVLDDILEQYQISLYN